MECALLIRVKFLLVFLYSIVVFDKRAEKLPMPAMGLTSSSNTETTARYFLYHVIFLFIRRRKLPFKMQTGLRDGLDAIGDKARYVSAAAVRLKDRLGHNESDSGM